MAGAATQAGIDYLLNLLRRAEEPVSNYYISLIAQLPPGFTIGGEELDEPTEIEYARAQVVNEAANWEVVENSLVNTVEISFPVAQTDWGQLNFWAIGDQPRELGGRIFFCGQFDEPLYVEEDDQVFLAPGTIGIEMSGSQWLMGLT